MRYSQARQGRTFVIRLEDGDIVHESIELLARREGVRAGHLIILGGADAGSSLVVGPERSRGVSPVTPMSLDLDDAREVAGVGTLFPDESGTPVLHMHMACGHHDRVHPRGREGLARHGGRAGGVAGHGRGPPARTGHGLQAAAALNGAERRRP